MKKPASILSIAVWIFNNNDNDTLDSVVSGETCWGIFQDGWGVRITQVIRVSSIQLIRKK